MAACEDDAAALQSDDDVADQSIDNVAADVDDAQHDRDAGNNASSFQPLDDVYALLTTHNASTSSARYLADARQMSRS